MPFKKRLGMLNHNIYYGKIVQR